MTREQQLIRIDEEIARLKALRVQVADHDIALCETDKKHVTTGQPTGGRDGEFMTTCRVCGKVWFGYD